MRTFRGHRAFKESMAMVSKRQVLVKLLNYWRVPLVGEEQKRLNLHSNI